MKTPVDTRPVQALKIAPALMQVTSSIDRRQF